jgi:hypothetical protein
LPSLIDLLVNRDAAEGEGFDLVIDVNGSSGALSLKSRNILDFHAL